METLADVMRARGYDNMANGFEKSKTNTSLKATINNTFKEVTNSRPTIALKENTASHVKTAKLKYIDNSSIFNTSNSQIELPEQISKLVDNKGYLPKHKKLANKHGVKYLLKLAELSETKKMPSHWYAKVTSKNNWENKTLPMLEKLFKAIDSAKKAMQKLGFKDKWLKFYTKVAYRTTEAKFNGILEQAQTSANTTPQYYFRYLVSQV